jgi:cell division septum initiation protein DivIVA
VVPRFAITRQGYDCAAVDEHIAELERELVDLDRELAELRARTSSGGEVAAEIQRIGEQTSKILLAAHDEAHETTCRAQEQADRCLADAAANAIAITEGANRKLREMEREKTSLARERSRLLEDIRGVASALSSVADDAADRFPAEPDAVGAPAAAGVKSAADA